MIGEITPLVKEAGRRAWVKAIVAHTIGATLSGAVLGFALGCLGLAARTHAWGSVSAALSAAVFLVCAAAGSPLLALRLPSFRRQTPSSWRCALGDTWGPFAWGLDLGQGWTTAINYAGYYGVVAWSFLRGEPAISAATVAAFGLGRAIPVILAGTAQSKIDYGTLT